MSTFSSIYHLAPGEVEEYQDSYWRRVPGGWIVTESFWDDKNDSLVRLHPVFVPFSDEFDPSKDHTIGGLQRKIEGAHPMVAPPERVEVTIPSRINNDITDDDNNAGF